MSAVGSGGGTGMGGSASRATSSGRLRLVWLVAKRDYLRTVRRRGYVFGTLLLPLGVAALMALSAFLSVNEMDGSSDSGTIVIVNESDVPIADVNRGTRSDHEPEPGRGRRRACRTAACPSTTACRPTSAAPGW